MRIAADSSAARRSTQDAWLHGVAFAAGIVVLIGLVVAATMFARRFFAALDRRSPIGVRRQWGGFGGGDGGWEASPALSLLMVTVVLALLATTVASTLLSAASRLDGIGSAARAPAASQAAAPNAATK